VTESLKLLAIPPAIQDLCRHADITAKSILLLIARAPSIPEMERLVQEIAEENLDRAAARASAAAGGAGGTSQTANHDTDADTATGRFRPLQIRLRTTPNSPVRLSLTIRRPGVSKDEVIATLETLLEQLRAGDLDERLSAPFTPGQAPKTPR
jgi:hypothetical protein